MIYAGKKANVSLRLLPDLSGHWCDRQKVLGKPAIDYMSHILYSRHPAFKSSRLIQSAVVIRRDSLAVVTADSLKYVGHTLSNMHEGTFDCARSSSRGRRYDRLTTLTCL